MTDATGALVSDVIFRPFGEVNNISENPATTDMRFPGQWFQLQNGLAYNWHRHYDASLGRYVSSDPLGLTAMLSDGPNTYGYAGQRPGVFVDPRGLNTGIFLGGPNTPPSIIRDNNAIINLLKGAFGNAAPEGISATKSDKYHAAASDPSLKAEAIAKGTYFVIGSGGAMRFSILLQHEYCLDGVDGIVEYMIPVDSKFFKGTPSLTHQTFIPQAPISGVPNNWYGKKARPFGGL
jgi:RHS repeat-associated protein